MSTSSTTVAELVFFSTASAVNFAVDQCTSPDLVFEIYPMLFPTNMARPRWAVVAAAIAVLFGGLTIWMGGRALFGGVGARAEVGNAVGFVLWFNFLCGFFYVLAGIGLFLWRRWAALLSAGIASTTLLIFVAFGWHVVTGGAFEMRTVGAMTLRSVFWIAIAFAACHALGCRRHVI